MQKFLLMIMIRGCLALKIRNKLKNINILFCLILGTLLLSAQTVHATPEPISVNITGVDKTLADSLRTNIALLYENTEDIDIDYLKEYEERTKETALLTLQIFGYYSPEVIPHLRIHNKQIVANIEIHLGQPVIIKKIYLSVSGNDKNNPAIDAILNSFPLKPGERLLHEAYTEGKKAILSKIIQAGYLKAAFTEHQIEVDPSTYSSEIFLTLDPGPRHYFGEVHFNNTVLSSAFLNRYLDFAPGETYSSEKTLALQSSLIQSDYFKHVNVKPNIDEHSPCVPIQVELEDAKPNHYLIGGGYGTDTGLRGKLGWTRRRLNPQGHHLSAKAQIAEVYHIFQLDYTIPGKHPQTDSLKFKTEYQEEEYSEQPSQVYEAGVIEERFLSGWLRRISVNYRHEQFPAFGTGDTIHSKLVLPSISFIQTKYNPNAAFKQGRHIEFTMRGSVDALISDTSFFQSTLQVKWLKAFSDTFKTSFRTELGFTLPDDSDNLPLSQRFFAGGDVSLRGYGYRSLPNEIDKNGVLHPVGGAYLAIGSLELTYTVKKPFNVFTFFDAGNAFRRNNNEIAMGTGVGIEWETKLGPVKFAVAKPLTKPADSWRIHASFGPEL